MSEALQFRLALALVVACILFTGWVGADTSIECGANRACAEALRR